MKKLKDIDLYKVGDSIQMVGTIFADDANMYLCLFPEDRGDVISDRGAFFTPNGRDIEGSVKVETLDMDRADWDTFLRQTDLMETEVITKASDGTLAKVILRKTQRQIDSDIQWRVFRKAGYRCEYCGNDNCPLTVDHLITWENSGPSVVENLAAACRKCNKIRGNLPYTDWLRHPRYLELSKNLTEQQRLLNEARVEMLDKIPLRIHIKSR